MVPRDLLRRVRGIVSAGVSTDRYEESVRFFRDVLGVPFAEEAQFAWARMPNTSMLEVFRPEHPNGADFTTGPVVEFLVDDLEAAVAELQEAGVELLGGIEGSRGDGGVHFRAPDGNVYGLVNGHAYRR